MKRWLGVICLLFVPLLVTGCGVKELGPVDAEDVPEADQAEVERQMKESREKAMDYMKNRPKR